MVTQNARTDPGKYPSLSKVVFLTPSRKSIEKTQETVANNSHLIHYVRTERLSVRTQILILTTHHRSSWGSLSDKNADNNTHENEEPESDVMGAT